MPVYEYVCTACGHPIEVMHSFSTQGPGVCERCGGTMRKAVSTPAIVFKGSGWAKKDHRDKVHASTSAAKTPAGDAAAAATASPAATSSAEGAVISKGEPASPSGSAGPAAAPTAPAAAPAAAASAAASASPD